MKASLQLKMSQSLTMTPQLQQAIKLLQLSTLELQQEIQEALDSNPLLEVEEDFHGDIEGAGSQLKDLSLDQTKKNEPEQESSATDQKLQDDVIPEQMEVDTDWSDIYDHAPTSASSYSGDDEYSFENKLRIL